MTDVEAARRLAAECLAARLPRRWRHVQAVAAEAARLADCIGIQPVTPVCAAWLHDVGYAPDIADSGFHPLDGARFLRRSGWPDGICHLVAHHSCARVEARERGLGRDLLAEFIDTSSPERDALWTSDATTGPDGQRLTLDERVREIEQRYGADHVVSRCMRRIRPELDAAIARTRSRSHAGGNAEARRQ